METIKLQDIEGFAEKSGIDEQGSRWVEFEVDYLADQDGGICSICGAILSRGWLCLDGGEEVCSSHIEY